MLRSGEAIERPEGECFCCKACSSYIAELAKELGDSMKDVSAEAFAAEADGGMQQQGHPQQRQQSQAQKQRPKVAARGKEGPTMLANVQVRQQHVACLPILKAGRCFQSTAE